MYAAERSTLVGSLPLKAPAAVATAPAVGVDDDLATRQPGVAVGPADLELAGGVDVDDRLAVPQLLGHAGLNHMLDDLLLELRLLGLAVPHRVVLRESTTVSMRTGFRPSYSTVTWLLASGRRPLTLSERRALAC
jgi:hypothetical protein